MQFELICCTVNGHILNSFAEWLYIMALHIHVLLFHLLSAYQHSTADLELA